LDLGHGAWLKPRVKGRPPCGIITQRPSHSMRTIAALALTLGAALTDPFIERAIAQVEPPLVGPARGIALAELVYPVVFDPLITLPLTPIPQATIEAHGRDVSGTLHLAVRNGDDSYGITVSGPLSRSGDLGTVVDPRGLRSHSSLGFDLTNIVWRPRARPTLEQLLRPEGFVRLNPESRAAVARAITTTDAVDAPWALVFNASYRFSRDGYSYIDPITRASRSATHLNDIAAAMFGTEFHVRPGDPGYFAGVSYTYSAVFHDADQIQGVRTGPPSKVRGNLLRVELRRPFAAARLGINPSLTYDLNSRVKTVDASTYLWLASDHPAQTKSSTRLYAGVSVGYQSGTGGFFATIFAGPLFGGRP
jgi:hypothetical protein